MTKEITLTVKSLTCYRLAHLIHTFSNVGVISQFCFLLGQNQTPLECMYGVDFNHQSVFIVPKGESGFQPNDIT